MYIVCVLWSHLHKIIIGHVEIKWIINIPKT